MVHSTFNLEDEKAKHSGDSFTIDVEVLDGVPTEDETDDDYSPINLTDATATYIVLDDYTGEELANKLTAYDNNEISALIEKTTSNGIEIVDAPNGIIRIEVDTEETTEMYGEYHHRLRITDHNGNRATVFDGTLEIVA